MAHHSLRVTAALAFTVVLVGMDRPAHGQGPAPTLTVLAKEGRRTLPLTVANEQELLYLDDLASAFQLVVREESLGALTVAYKGRTILLTPDQPLVSIAGRLVSLPAPATRAGRRWLVPVEFVSRALALIYDSRLELRKPSRLLIVGDLRVPRVTIRMETGDPARLIVDATPRTTSTVSQVNSSLDITFDADALDVAMPPLQPQGLVQAIRVMEPASVQVDLGPRFTGFRSTLQAVDASARLTIDLAAQADQQAGAPVAPPQALPPPDL